MCSRGYFLIILFLRYIKTFAHTVIVMLRHGRKSSSSPRAEQFPMKCKTQLKIQPAVTQALHMMRGSHLKKILLGISGELFSNRDIKRRLGRAPRRDSVIFLRAFLLTGQ